MFPYCCWQSPPPTETGSAVSRVQADPSPPSSSDYVTDELNNTNQDLPKGDKIHLETVSTRWRGEGQVCCARGYKESQKSGFVPEQHMMIATSSAAVIQLNHKGIWAQLILTFMVIISGLINNHSQRCRAAFYSYVLCLDESCCILRPDTTANTAAYRHQPAELWCTTGPHWPGTGEMLGQVHTGAWDKQS